MVKQDVGYVGGQLGLLWFDVQIVTFRSPRCVYRRNGHQLGELSVRGGEPGAGYSLVLDAARKTNDAVLYQRAVEIALQSRSGDSAVQAARAWQLAQPTSREANRYLLQIFVALNRLADSAEPLTRELDLTPATEQAAFISRIPGVYPRVVDKKLAADVVQGVLTKYLPLARTGAQSWVAIGRLRLAAGDAAAALDAAQRAQAVNPQAEGAAVLALEIMDPKQPQAETLVLTYLANKQVSTPVPQVRMGYARALLDMQRYAEASEQLQKIVADVPAFAEAWLVLGALQVQDNQLALADKSLKQYLALTQDLAASDEKRRGQTQAFLSLAQVAEKQRDFAAQIRGGEGGGELAGGGGGDGEDDQRVAKGVAERGGSMDIGGELDIAQVVRVSSGGVDGGSNFRIPADQVDGLELGREELGQRHPERAGTEDGGGGEREIRHAGFSPCG